ncbi:MAG: DUF2345 domain-containing protein, partial [Burkholderiaceae bacterium]
TSGGHTSVSAGKSLLASAKEAIRLFAYKAGIKLISANKDIDIQTLKSNIHALAKTDITLTANRIEIKGQEEVLMNGGGSWQRWAKEGISRGTSGSHTLHAARHDLNGPASMPLQAAPETALYNEMLVLHDKKGRPVANFPYRITLGNGRVISGITDSQGRTQRVGSADAPVPLHIDRQTEH